MKNYLRNYLTPSEQKIIIIIIAIAFLSLIALNKPFSTLYSNEVSPDSIKADIEKPYQICVDIKTASEVELTQIKGIGFQTAKKIISFRDSIDIKSNYDLLKINGIGEKSLSKWIPFLKALPGDTLRFTKNLIEQNTQVHDNNKMDINKASLKDLLHVKGIGEKKAKQIIAFRDKMNGLSSMQELLAIKGIGKKTLAKIEEEFYIGNK